MNRFKKVLIEQGLVVPIVIAVIAAAVFFIALPSLSNAFPFTEKAAVMADYEVSDVKTVYEKPVKVSDGEIKKSSIENVEDNTVFGEIAVNGDKLELIYNAENKNAVNRYNLSDKGVLIGEVGCSFIECYKSSADSIRALKAGDKVEINTSYGSYKYEIVKTDVVKNELQLFSAASGIGRAVTFYTDNSSGPGISDSTLVIVGKMISGPEVTE